MAFAFVQDDQGDVVDGGTLAFTNNVGNDTLLVALITIGSAGRTVTGITDSLTNTWAQAAGINGDVAASAFIWWAHCATGGANTLTFDFSGTGTFEVTLAEFSGFTGGVTVDQNASVNGDNDATWGCGSITTTQADSVILAVQRLLSAFAVSSRDDGQTILTDDARSTNSYKISTATETLIGQITFAASEDGSGCIANFYTTAGGGGVVIPVFMHNYRRRRV